MSENPEIWKNTEVLPWKSAKISSILSPEGESVTKPYELKYVGDNLYHLRKHILGLSQEEFSEKVGLSKDTISNIERGKYLPNLSNLVSISNATNVTLDYFLYELKG